MLLHCCDHTHWKGAAMSDYELERWRELFAQYGATPHLAAEKIEHTIRDLTRRWSDVLRILIEMPCHCADTDAAFCDRCLILETHTPGLSETLATGA
jgi:hypothetical protein